MIAAFLLAASAASVCPDALGPSLAVGVDALVQTARTRSGGSVRLRHFGLAAGGPNWKDGADWDAAAVLEREGPQVRQLLTGSAGQVQPLTAEALAGEPNWRALRGAPLGDTARSTPVPAGADVFVGASDGFLHAFALASGHEDFAFAPPAVVPDLARLVHGKSSGTPVAPAPAVASITLGGHTRTVLVAANGGGHDGAFALDVSAPARMEAGLGLLWDYADPELGPIKGPPQIVQLRVGAVLRPFVLLSGRKLVLLALDKAPRMAWQSGDTLFQFRLPSRELAPPAIVVNGDGSLRRLYVGDVQGRLWRLDLTGPAPWTQSETVHPVFLAHDANGYAQPILAAPRIAHAADGYVILLATGAAPGRSSHASLYAIPDSELPPTHTRSRSDLGVAGAGWRTDFAAEAGSVLASPVLAGAVVALTLSGSAGDACTSASRIFSFDWATGDPRVNTSINSSRLAAEQGLILLHGAAELHSVGSHQAQQFRTLSVAAIDATGRWQLVSSIPQRAAMRRLSWREVANWLALHQRAGVKP